MQVASKAVAFFPFEDSISKQDFLASEERRGTRFAEYCTIDDDFEEPFQGSLRPLKDDQISREANEVETEGQSEEEES